MLRDPRFHGGHALADRLRAQTDLRLRRRN
jgi:hypothetical protein